MAAFVDESTLLELVELLEDQLTAATNPVDRGDLHQLLADLYRKHAKLTAAAAMTAEGLGGDPQLHQHTHAVLGNQLVTDTLHALGRVSPDRYARALQVAARLSLPM